MPTKLNKNLQISITFKGFSCILEERFDSVDENLVLIMT